MGDEWIGHEAETTFRDGSASGSNPQAAAKPWASMPNATLVRVYTFAKAMNAVSSTSAGAPSAFRSRADARR